MVRPVLHTSAPARNHGPTTSPSSGGSVEDRPISQHCVLASTSVRSLLKAKSLPRHRTPCRRQMPTAGGAREQAPVSVRTFGPEFMHKKNKQTSSDSELACVTLHDQETHLGPFWPRPVQGTETSAIPKSLDCPAFGGAPAHNTGKRLTALRVSPKHEKLSPSP